MKRKCGPTGGSTHLRKREKPAAGGCSPPISGAAFLRRKAGYLSRSYCQYQSRVRAQRRWERRLHCHNILGSKWQESDRCLAMWMCVPIILHPVPWLAVMETEVQNFWKTWHHVRETYFSSLLLFSSVAVFCLFVCFMLFLTATTIWSYLVHLGM